MTSFPNQQSNLFNNTYLPGFIRGLLENVGPQIDPQRLIRRIKNGLEIPGLKEALIKILGDFNLQASVSSFSLPFSFEYL